MKLFLWVLLMLLSVTSAAAQSNVTFTWAATATDITGNPTTISGYKLYLSKTSFISPTATPTVVTVGTDTTATASLDSGIWYGQITAYNSAGESARSNQLSFVVPKLIPIAPLLRSAGIP